VKAPEAMTRVVNAVNDAPVAYAQAATTAEDTAVAITLSGADVDLCIFDITGTMIWRGSDHYDGVGQYDMLWRGVNAFNERVSNGVYPFFLIADKKIIGKSKIAVMR
jgi:hypothetical protein